MTRFFTLMIAVALIGCHTSPPPQPISIDVPFRDADFQPWVGTGNANVEGQAFLKTIGGDVKTCAGQIVALFPNNSYTQAALFAMAASQADAVRPMVDNRLDNYVPTQRCDAQGNFAFTNIRPNSWIVLARITWFAPSEYGLKQQGGTLAKGINARAGDNRMILTGADEVVP